MIEPMLAAELDVRQIGVHAINPDTRWQQKIDGDRVVAEALQVDGKTVLRFWGRNGQTYTKPIGERIKQDLRGLAAQGTFVLDGELLDFTYHVFDLVRVVQPDGRIVLDETDEYATRRMQLEMIADVMFSSGGIRLVREASTEADKRALFEAIRLGGGEGVIIRRADDRYRQAERAILKVKFTKTVDVVVLAKGLDGHDNCEYGVYPTPRSRKPLIVGRCSLSGKPHVKVGDVLEVRFLYATRTAKTIRLYQPRMLRIRDDKRPRECLVDQLEGSFRSLDLLD